MSTEKKPPPEDLPPATELPRWGSINEPPGSDVYSHLSRPPPPKPEMPPAVPQKAEHDEEEVEPTHSRKKAERDEDEVEPTHKRRK